MTTINATINPALAKRTRTVYGLVLICVGLFIYLVLGLNTQPGLQTTFGVNLSGSQALSAPDVIVPAQLTITQMAGIAIFFGAFQMARGVRSSGCLPHLGCPRQIFQSDRHAEQLICACHAHRIGGFMRSDQ